jgi:hypothetical protein
MAPVIVASTLAMTWVPLTSMRRPLIISFRCAPRGVWAEQGLFVNNDAHRRMFRDSGQLVPRRRLSGKSVPPASGWSPAPSERLVSCPG